MTRYTAQVWRMIEEYPDGQTATTRADVIGKFEFAQLPALHEHIQLPNNPTVYHVENVVHFPLYLEPGASLVGVIVASIRVSLEQ